jgi:endoglucanase
MLRFNSTLTPGLVKSAIVIFSIILFTHCSEESTPESITDPVHALSDLDPFEQNARLGRGINLGNILEAPSEGEWGLTLKEYYFEEIAEAGFNSVRLPIRWSAHAETEAPYTIDQVFFERIDWAIDCALKNGLAINLNIHHYEEIFEDPASEKERYLAIWDQIAVRYLDQPKEVFFEVLNEPHDNLTSVIWNEYLIEAIDVIRVTNPGRTIIVGTAEWGGFSALSRLSLPENDRNIIVTLHYYNPFQFTHQGAEWVEGADQWLGTAWANTPSQREAIISDFDAVLAWATINNRPINIGEFGAYSRADMDSRYLWTYFITSLSELYNMSWHYWEFGAGFGAYDLNNNQWHEELLEALIRP